MSVQNTSSCSCIEQAQELTQARQEEIAMATYRMGIYRLMSNAFLYEPSSDELRDMVCLAKASADCNCRESEQAFLETFTSFETDDYEALRTQVASEYAELFIGPRPPLAPLYGSVYLDLHERLFADSTMKVRSHYENCGLRAKRRNQVPEDHIGSELEFMAWLCGEEISALEQNEGELASQILGEQLRFLKECLVSWVGDFTQKIEDTGYSAYYVLWSRFVRDFANEDVAYLESQR